MKQRAKMTVPLMISSPFATTIAMIIEYLFCDIIPYTANRSWLNWRIVFALGLAPALISLFIRLFVQEPEAWKNMKHVKKEKTRVQELFQRNMLRSTLGGLQVATVILISWWCLNSFITSFTAQLAQLRNFPSEQEYKEMEGLYELIAFGFLNAGGIAGGLLLIPFVDLIGRLWWFRIIFSLLGVLLFCIFGIPTSILTSDIGRMAMLFPIGVLTTAYFAISAIWLPELFPTRIRGTGTGFTYNVARVLTAIFPFIIGYFIELGYSPMFVLMWIGLVPLVGVFLLIFPLARETSKNSMLGL